ncbi:chemotaxis protein CheW [Halocatena halophila]|uniref:chemotaxis protein CheW n=1 Tax=Halocatena halophila TaxID=2814576 RepID=UPI002ED4C723
MSQSRSDDTDTVAAKSRVEFVHARIDSERWAIERGRVRRLIRSPQLTRIPRAPEPIAGATEQGGTVTAVIDGRTLCGDSKGQRQQADGVLVVFDGPQLEQRTGLLVDHVTGIESHSVDQISAVAKKQPQTASYHCARIDETAWVLDPNRLIDAISTGDASANSDQ